MGAIQRFNMEDIFTNKLSEKIYHGNYLNIEDIKKQLKSFFNELIKRKRNDPLEGGLQASIIIYKDRCAFKINELDGAGLHVISEVNLTKFLYNDNNYLTEKAAGHFGLYMSEMMTITKDAISVRILDGEDKLMVAITSSGNIQSKFEIEVLKYIINICKNIKENNYYKL